MCIIEKFEQELRLTKAEQTVKNYTKQFKMFVNYFRGQDIRYLSEDTLKSYVLSLHNIYGYSAIVHAISAIKFYYLHLSPRKRKINIPNPPKPERLPDVLSPKEVKAMIDCTYNLKHKALLEIIFYHGLRRSEVLNLRAEHIDSPNMALKVNQGKGFKDRNIPLNKTCLNTLRKYYKEFKPENYLFNGQHPNEQYSATSLNNVIRQAAKRAGIRRRVYPHILRHSFASYLVDKNINLRKIQEWMGHKSSKTTELYTHIKHEENPIIL